METYCQNPLCQNETFREVRVSVEKPSDEIRALCAICEEAYTWGVQHGEFLARSRSQNQQGTVSQGS